MQNKNHRNIYININETVTIHITYHQCIGVRQHSLKNSVLPETHDACALAMHTYTWKGTPEPKNARPLCY